MSHTSIPLKGVWNQTPAKKWEEGAVAGNGRQGVIVYGDPQHETIIGNHCRLFLPQGHRFEAPDLAEDLPELRNRIKRKGYEDALRFHYRRAREKGYQGLTMSDPYHPGFHLHIESPLDEYQNYMKSINYQTGEIRVSYEAQGINYESRCFVSRADDWIVYQLKSSNRSLDCKLFLADYQREELECNSFVSEKLLTANYHYVYGHGGYKVKIQIIAPDALSSKVGNKILVKDTNELLLLMKIEPLTSKPKLDQAFLLNDETNYHYLFSRHRKLHQQLFDRVSLDITNDRERIRDVETLLEEAKYNDQLPLPLIEKIYDAGRYMYISSAGERTPNLQGIWTGTFHPAWSGDYTFDTNVQLAIAGALSSHLFEGLHGLFRLVRELLPGFRENAKKYYGCQGIMSSIHSSHSGVHVHWNEEWPLHLWTCGAGWIGHWYYQYYRYTGDLEFLRKEVVPYLKEIVLFYEDFLIEDQDGTYRFTPSYSAENGCGDNATQDVAVAKEVLGNLIESYKILNIDSNEPLKWKTMIDKLPAYQVNEDGALKEWLTPDKGENYNHRHFSHLYPIFQSREFTEETNPEMFRACQVAFEKRLEAWLLNDDGDTTSTHGRMHTALCATQFHRSDLIKEVFMLLIKNNCFFPSLMMSHYNHQEVFNVDGNGAFPQVIHEMLVDYHHDTLYVLQALPTDINCGELHGVRLADQIEIVALKWNLEDKVVKVTMVSEYARTLKIKAPLFNKIEIASDDTNIQADYSDVYLPEKSKVTFKILLSELKLG